MEERKFKVGDKVRIIDDATKYKDKERYYGCEGYIFGELRDTYYIEVNGIVIIGWDEELELVEHAKPTPLTWLQIQERIGKPVWDNYDKKWRVIYMYREIKGNAKVVEFTDSSACYTYKEDRFYDEEVGE